MRNLFVSPTSAVTDTDGQLQCVYILKLTMAETGPLILKEAKVIQNVLQIQSWDRIRFPCKRQRNLLIISDVTTIHDGTHSAACAKVMPAKLWERVSVYISQPVPCR